MRFPAALHVVLFHYGLDFVPAWADSAVRGAHGTLPMFFVLSGFILIYNYGGAFEESGLTRRGFHLARFARIYPLYGALVLLELAFMLGPLPSPDYIIWPGTLAHLFMVQGHFVDYFHSGNVPGWSIGAEAFFYFLFPWIQKAARSHRRAMLLVLLALSYGLQMGIAASAHYYAPSEVQELVASAPISILPEFIFGVALGWLYRLDLDAGRRLPGDLLVLPAAALVVFFTVHHDLVPHLMMQNGFLAPFYGALIYGLSHGGRIARALSLRPLVHLGELSFAIYLLQVPVYHAFEIARVAPTSGRELCVYLAVLVVASFATYSLFERPVQRALRRGVVGRIGSRPDRPRDNLWLVAPTSAFAVLLGIETGALATPFRGPILGVDPIEGVRHLGLYGTEWLDDRRFRWTDGHAKLRVPIDRRPSAVRVDLGPPPRPGATVRIQINHTVHFDGPLPEDGLSRAFPFDDPRPNRQVIFVTIESSTFAPAADDPRSTDDRVLGVTFYGIEFIY